MRDFLSQGLFFIIIQSVVCLSVFLLFLAVLIDFTLYSTKEKVQKEKKSIVETGTMTLFFLSFYLILQSGAGVVPIPSELLKYFVIILGTVMIVAGCTANIFARFNLGKNWANQIKIYEEHTLVETGLYSIVRHPLYSSIILMFYGAGLVYRNIFSLIAVSVIFVPFMVYRASQEEHLLGQKFPRYEQYQQRVGMLFPKCLKRKERFRDERIQTGRASKRSI